MSQARGGRAATLPINLPQLQSLVKRDPVSYKDDVLQQLHHFQNMHKIADGQGSTPQQIQRVKDLAAFLIQVLPFFQEEMGGLPTEFSNMLLYNQGTLHRDIRDAFTRNLVVMQRKGIISTAELLRTLLPLAANSDSSTFRSMLSNTVATEITRANTKRKDHTLNQTAHAFLFNMLSSDANGEGRTPTGASLQRPMSSKAGGQATSQDQAALWAISLAVQLCEKNVWNDAKSTTLVSSGCFHPNHKVQSLAVRFFLGLQEKEAASTDTSEVLAEMRSLQRKMTVRGKTSRIERRMSSAKKANRKNHEDPEDTDVFKETHRFHLLHDPHTFGEKLYQFVTKNEKYFSYEHKLLYMQLISRLIGSFKLCIFDFMIWMTKYIAYKQTNVTAILSCLAQASHDLIPPEVLNPIVQKVAKEFIHPGASVEAITVGINTIREICRRQPAAMEQDLLSDLLEYRLSKHKGVMSAARGLLHLYREVNPGLLHRKHKGKAVEQSSIVGDSGSGDAFISDIKLLDQHWKESAEPLENEQEGDSKWEITSQTSLSSSSGEWNDVSENGSVIDIDYSDDDSLSESSGPSGVEHERYASAITSANQDQNVMPSIALTQILTPEDYRTLAHLKRSEGSRADGKSNAPGEETGVMIDEDTLRGPQKHQKADYAERMDSISKGREGREKYTSSKARKTYAVENRDKSRRKPIMMVLQSGHVRQKKKMSLREKQMKLRAHHKKQKGKR